MAKPKERPSVEPYSLTWAQVAEAVFQRGESWLRENIDRLVRDQGFPRPDPRMPWVFNRRELETWVNAPYGYRPGDDVDLKEMLYQRAKFGRAGPRS